MLAYCINIEECMNVEVEINEKQWYHNIKSYIKDVGYTCEAMDSETNFIRHIVCQFFLIGEILLKRNHYTTLLRCINATEADYSMEEMHKACLEPILVDPCWPGRL